MIKFEFKQYTWTHPLSFLLRTLQNQWTFIANQLALFLIPILWSKAKYLSVILSYAPKILPEKKYVLYFCLSPSAHLNKESVR